MSSIPYFAIAGRAPNFARDALEAFIDESERIGWTSFAEKVLSLYRDQLAGNVIFDPARKVTIYGGSDDLVGLEGGISEEFGAFDAEESTLTFNEGTVVGIKYGDEGIWRTRIISPGTANVVEHIVSNDPDGDYSDRLTLEGDLRVCEFRRGKS